MYNQHLDKSYGKSWNASDHEALHTVELFLVSEEVSE